MFNIDIKLLVALAPAILCTLLMAGCYVPRLVGGAFARLSKNEDALEWWYHVVLHAAFYGSVLNVLFGVEVHSRTGEAIIALWFAGCLAVSRYLGKLLGSIRAEEREEDRLRMAETVSRIAESELGSKLDG